MAGCFFFEIDDQVLDFLKIINLFFKLHRQHVDVSGVLFPFIKKNFILILIFSSRTSK